MKHRTRNLSIAVALLAGLAPGCSDDPSTGKDLEQATKKVGEKVGDGLAEAADDLERFAQTVAANLSETTEDVGRNIQAKLPAVESLLDKAKLQLEAGSAQSQELAAKLDEKLAALKTKLDQLARDGANASRELKDEVVEAFRDLVASIKSGLAKLRA